MKNSMIVTVPSISHRLSQLDEMVNMTGSGPNAYDSDGIGIEFHLGGGYFQHVAPGFEGCLDAPMCIPAGSHVCSGVQPIMD